MTAHPLYQLLRKLDLAKIHYSIARHREDSVMLTITLVGERIEVDVFENGEMEVSRFLGTEDVLGGEELMNQLLMQEIDSKDLT